MASEDFVTQGECNRSHEALQRENDRSNETVTTAIGGLSDQVGKLWDSMETLRISFRNHVPPWTAAVMTVQALVVGVLGGRQFWH
ncbi:MAG: hypothetical protein ACYC5F_09805 [Thermoleophilia bacterium]